MFPFKRYSCLKLYLFDGHSLTLIGFLAKRLCRSNTTTYIILKLQDNNNKMTDSHLYVHVHEYVEWLETCLTSANGETASMHRTCTPCTERPHHAQNVHTMH